MTRILATADADELKQIDLPGDRAYPESIASSKDGTLFVSSLASGGIWRIKPGSAVAELWIKPGAYETGATFGVLVDQKSNLLWVCSNDISVLGLSPLNQVKGSFVKGFDLSTGEGKVSVPLPQSPAICNDLAIGPDGNLYITNSLSPQILLLKPGSANLAVWLESAAFEQPAKGPALDGIAFGEDGNLYVNTYLKGDFYRVEVKDGVAGKITKLVTSRPLNLPDGLRPTGDLSFLMAEGGGALDRVTVSGASVSVQTIRDGLAGPVGVAMVNEMLWVPEGQLAHLFDAKKGPPRLPFRLVAIPAN